MLNGDEDRRPPDREGNAGGGLMNSSDNLALAIWLAAIVAIVYLFYLVCYVDAATLTITGSAAGHGICNLTVQADIISANVSQAINSSSWEIVAGGI